MIHACLVRAAARLKEASASPRLDAELLLADALGIERSRLAVVSEDPLPAAAAERFEALLAQRVRGVPVAYLLGRRDFWTLSLEVGPGVLVPRPETELLVEIALEALRGRPQPRILDLGTGSGAIGLALATERPDASVDLVDASPAALVIAERNRRALGLENARTRLGSWFADLAGQRYDAIVSNPPYLGEADPHLAGPGLAHEPREALVPGPTGLEALAAIAAAAPTHLLPGGLLVLEHGATQAGAVRELLAGAALTAIGTRQDLAGLDRATQGTRRD